MSRKQYDPLDFVPSPQAIKDKLAKTRALMNRLTILLDLSEKLHRSDAVHPPQVADTPSRLISPEVVHAAR